MSTAEGGGNIVTDGLVLYLDAANPRSIISGSITWNDLTKNLNNGTLINGPTYNTTNGGNIVFDGSNQLIDCGNTSILQITQGSICAWFKATNTNFSYNGVLSKRNAWGIFLVNNILSIFDWGNYYASGFDINQGLRSTGINVGDNNWYNVVLTFTETTGIPSNNAIIYLNGIPVLITTVRHYDQTYSVQLAEANFNQFFTGNISATKIYNKVLTPSEVLQNYNALKNRFGL